MDLWIYRYLSYTNAYINHLVYRMMHINHIPEAIYTNKPRIIR